MFTYSSIKTITLAINNSFNAGANCSDTRVPVYEDKRDEAKSRGRVGGSWVVFV